MEIDGNSDKTLFSWAPKLLHTKTAAMNKKTLAPWKKSYDQPRQHIEKLRHYFANKCPSSQGYDFSSGHVWMWELDCEGNWAPKNWCFWPVVLGKMEKEMAAHSSGLAWRIPGTGEPGGLPSMGSQRVGHDWSDLAAVAAAVGEDSWESLGLQGDPTSPS